MIPTRPWPEFHNLAEQYDALGLDHPARTNTKIAFIDGGLAALDNCKRWMRLGPPGGYRRHQRRLNGDDIVFIVGLLALILMITAPLVIIATIIIIGGTP